MNKAKEERSEKTGEIEKINVSPSTGNFIGYGNKSEKVLVFYTDETVSKKYKGLEIHSARITGKNCIIVRLLAENSEIKLEQIFNLIDKHANTIGVTSVLEELRSLLSIDAQKLSYTKFRGDFGEAIFLLQNGGKKLHDAESADVSSGGSLFEVKTFSQPRNLVKISHKQLANGARKVAVNLKVDSENGLTITQLADRLSDQQFAVYLKGKYVGTPLDEIKYGVSVPFEITEQLNSINVILREPIVDAVYHIVIREE